MRQPPFWNTTKELVCVAQEWIQWLYESDELEAEDLNGRKPTLYSQAVEYVDLNYLRWLFWLFFPLIVSFLLPVILCLMLLANAVFLHVYKLRNRIREAYGRSAWDGAISALASFWDAQGWICHGYEVYGLEHIPAAGGALIIYYHGALPLDVYYLLAKTILYKNRTIHCVADKFLWRIPGLGLLLNVFQATPGDRKNLVKELKNDKLICISPGGVREALFSNDYQLMWAKRKGFVRVALEANVPVIPMFTENCREAVWTPVTAQKIWRWIYEKTKLPLVPIFGYAPVKFRTYLGPPITSHLRHFTRQMTFAAGDTVSVNAECTSDVNLRRKGWLRKSKTESGDRSESIDSNTFNDDSGISISSDNIVRNNHRPDGFLEKEEQHKRLRVIDEENLREKIAVEVEELIRRYQRRPGSIILGILDRIPGFADIEKRYFRNRRGVSS